MRITDIQRFCMHDGPGLRTTVFVKGCPLRCAWCHNPETQSLRSQLLYYPSKCLSCRACAVCQRGVHRFDGPHGLDREHCVTCGSCAASCPTNALEVVGEDLPVDEIYRRIARDLPFYGKSGGVTLSGGEPTIQWEDALCLLRLCKDNGIHTAIETCGYFPTDVLEKLVSVCDLFLWDVKDTDRDRHLRYTGQNNDLILHNLLTADKLGAGSRLRCLLVAPVNTSEIHYHNLCRIYHRLHHCEGIEFLPYHAYGDAKAEALGLTVTSEFSAPSSDELNNAKRILRENGVPVL